MFCAHYYLKPGGNCDLSPRSDPHKEFVGKNVLFTAQPLEQTAQLAGARGETHHGVVLASIVLLKPWALLGGGARSGMAAHIVRPSPRRRRRQ